MNELDMNELDQECLLRFVAGLATAADQAAVRRWIGADRDRAALIDHLVATWNPGVLPPFDPHDKLRVELRTLIADRSPSPAVPIEVPALSVGTAPARSRRRLRPWWLGVAALILASVGVFSQRGGPRSEPPSVAAPTVHEYRSPRGQRAKLTLGDGTRVILGPESRLIVPASLADAEATDPSAREVILTGRAHFVVTRAQAPWFRVRTATGLIDDLGTEFVVSAYPDQVETEVVVASGRVVARPPAAATAADTGVRLSRGNLARLSGTEVTLLRRRVNVARYLAWTEGRHDFVRTRLGDAIRELSRAYDVVIAVPEPALLDRRLTASFAEEPIGRVLQVIASALDLELRQSGRSYVLRSRTDPS